VKVKSHVVETPVTEQVSLKQERVSVERRPVDRPLSGNERAFQDRTIEVEQKGQEAVVSKDARVKEEVVVKKDVQQRNQKVSDTVRRTEVEIEDERTRKRDLESSRPRR
jgi:stress response protein YsnF